MNTKISKGIHGWTAETRVPLDEGYALHILTMKRHNGAVVTTAQRVKLECYGFSYVAFQDFNMRVPTDLKVGRATEKAIADQHQRALAKLGEIKAACDAHYAKEVA